jgi:hypothetical protein
MLTRRAAGRCAEPLRHAVFCAHRHCPETISLTASRSKRARHSLWLRRLELTLDDYLNRQPVTGLLIAKDNTIWSSVTSMVAPIRIA